MTISSRALLHRVACILCGGLTAAALLVAPAGASVVQAVGAGGPSVSTTQQPPPGSATREQSSTSRESGRDDSAGDPYSRGRTASAVGQIVSQDDTSCTATVVGSDSGQVVVTAAHCVFVPETDVFNGGYSMLSDPGWVEGLEFIPGRVGDDAPLGVWPVERVWVDRQWQQTGDPAFDVAFLRIAEVEGQTVAEVAGSQGIRFGSSATSVTALGYPTMAPFDGTTLRYCSTDDAAADLNYRGALGMDCAMTQGASGGPWLAGFDRADGTGTVVAVTSFLALDDQDRMFASSLGEVAAELYRTADSG